MDFSLLPQPIFQEHPQWVALYQKAWQLAARNIRHRPSGRAYMDCAWDPQRNYQWVWDTCFMALYCRYAPGLFPGVESLDNFYDFAREDGFIAMTYDFDTGEAVYGEFINPPLWAWVEWEYYLLTGEASRFERVAPIIEKHMDWVDANRRTEPHRRARMKDGARGWHLDEWYQLYYFDDPGGSGMDDSPRAPRLPEAGKHFDWIDLSSQMALSFRHLALMHEALGADDKAAQWSTRFNELEQLINSELWCERTRFYHDRMLPLNFVSAKTAAGFWPLLAGICSKQRVQELVSHLLDEREFNRPVPVPTLSFDDPNYCPGGTYFTGGVWAPTNYMIARGLTHCGQREVAHVIAMKYLEALQRIHDEIEPHTLWECCCPESPLPGLSAYSLDRVKPDFVGWSGLGPIAMLIENILGLEVNAPQHKVEWDIRLLEEHGISKLPIGRSASVDLLCRKRNSIEESAHIEAMSQEKIQLVIACGTRRHTITLDAGKKVTFSF